MDPTTTRRISSPVDLLALVPCVLGFHPEDSLVLVVLAGEGTNLHARVDLPTTDEEADAVAASLLNAAWRVGGRQVALIAYSAHAEEAAEATRGLAAALACHDLDVVCTIRADGQRWYSLDCDEDCCPAQGWPYDLTTHAFTAQSVLDGQVTYTDRQALADSLVGTDPDRLEVVASAADDALRRLEDAAVRGGGAQPDAEAARRHLVSEGAWVCDRLRRRLETGEPLDGPETGRLVVALIDIDVRDVAWASMSRDNAEAHVELWREVVRHAPEELSAAPAALLGFAAWLAGDGALAWCAVDRCRRADPDYRLAELVADALTLAVPPSSWRPVEGERLPLFAD